MVTVFSKSRGKQTLIAKGSRRLASKKKAVIDTFNLAKLQVATGKSLGVITEAQTIDDFSQWKTNMPRVALAYYVIEIVDRLTRDDEAHPEVFDILVKFLANLSTFSQLKSNRVEISRQFLSAAGFADGNAEIGDVDSFIENIIERKLSSLRVGKKILD